MLNIEQTKTALVQKHTTSEELVTQCFDRINEAGSQGDTVFTELYQTNALQWARAVDQARKSGMYLPPFAGIPITVKDLFDVAGSTTKAGSVVLKGGKPALQDAAAVRCLKQAGFIVLGRTNMTEFAYSGLGLNPHYGTPLNPYDRAIGRIPGGSSSGAAVAITDGFAAGSLGTDTGGSCRIPAALCGIVGFKPTARRVSITGVLPLSVSLDSVGPLAASVRSCAAMDAVVAGEITRTLKAIHLKGLRLAVPQNYVLDSMDASVSRAFDKTLNRLSCSGVELIELNVPELEQIPHMNRQGGFAAAEAYAWHRSLLESSISQYDMRVSTRILKGASQSAADYVELVQARRVLIEGVNAKTRGFDAIICPTVPITAPSVAELEDEDAYHTNNLLMLRNPSVGNLLDRCAISLPCHEVGGAPVGVMLMGENGSDRQLLSMSLAIESLISPQ